MDIKKDLILETLNILSSREEQNRLWLDTSVSEMSSLGEDIYSLWDDSGLGDARDKGLFPEMFSQELCRASENFRKVVKKIFEDNLAYEIDHPKVVEMRGIAGNLYKMFNEELSDNSHYDNFL